ncbi:unnamed protein product [Cochlearia groenlandica]
MEANGEDDEPRKQTFSRRRRILFTIPLLLLLLLVVLISSSTSVSGSIDESGRRVIEARIGQDLIWIVQLSDLHFSVHHPERAIDFKNIVGPALSFINPSLVLITGDLTDGKSKDMLTMKQNEDEWLEYESVMEEVVKTSNLNKTIFYDLRGNHDDFGVPSVGSSVDFFSKYSINGQMARKEYVNSVTLETSERKHLFVGVDTTMHIGLRGPTNLFGHPTDELLSSLDSHLSQWDEKPTKPVTKISFGHFPLSFSALSQSKKSLKDVFLKHSISAYLCGHLHSSFGKNLKRHHHSGGISLSDNDLFQLNIRRSSAESSTNCSFGASPAAEFWEWEMGDWRSNRAMRIMAIDRGHVSYVDLDFKSKSQKTIILPTFPLDSRFMSTSSARHNYECQHMISSSYDAIRAIVFSHSLVVEVVARVYDSSPGFDNLVMEASMRKHGNDSSSSGASLYSLPWNYRAFEDPLPDRFWLQIEVTDIKGRSTFSEMRPFSINGLSSKVSWTWNEFRVMGIQWAALYYPILWSALYCLFLVFLIPKCIIIVFKKQYTLKKFMANKGPITLVLWILQDLCRVPVVWFGYMAYLVYLIFFPWFSGEVFTDSGNRTYMTIMGWVVTSSGTEKKHDYIGQPDVMVLVIPHLVFVVIPSVLVVCCLVVEREMYIDHIRTVSGKKEDDHDRARKRRSQRRSLFFSNQRLVRKALLLSSLALYWKHFKNCWALSRAYEMNLVLHFPGYSFVVPLLLLYVIHKTHKVT